MVFHFQRNGGLNSIFCSWIFLVWRWMKNSICIQLQISPHHPRCTALGTAIHGQRSWLKYTSHHIHKKPMLQDDGKNGSTSNKVVMQEPRSFQIISPHIHQLAPSIFMWHSRCHCKVFTVPSCALNQEKNQHRLVLYGI